MDINPGKFFRDSGSADVVTWHCSTAMGERSTQSAQARQQHHNLLLNRSVSARRPDNNTTTLTVVFQLDSLLLNRSVSAKQPAGQPFTQQKCFSFYSTDNQTITSKPFTYLCRHKYLRFFSHLMNCRHVFLLCISASYQMYIYSIYFCISASYQMYGVNLWADVPLTFHDNPLTKGRSL